MLIFAALVSTALGCLTQRTTKDKVKYALWSFVLFVVVGVGIAWLMYPFSRKPPAIAFSKLRRQISRFGAPSNLPARHTAAPMGRRVWLKSGICEAATR